MIAVSDDSKVFEGCLSLQLCPMRFTSSEIGLIAIANFSNVSTIAPLSDS